MDLSSEMVASRRRHHHATGCFKKSTGYIRLFANFESKRHRRAAGPRCSSAAPAKPSSRRETRWGGLDCMGPAPKSGADDVRVKTIAMRVPLPGLDSTVKSAWAFSRRERTMSAPSLSRSGHSTPSGRPMPSSATTTRQPFASVRLCKVNVPPSRSLNACFSVFARSSFTTSPAGIATLADTG
jgi:hypothetical protein